MTWDFFFRAERRSKFGNPKDAPARCIVLELPGGTTLADALVAARRAGAPRGSHRTGIFEVQNDVGIYEQVDGNRIDLTTPRRAAKTVFRTWEELDEVA